MDGAAESFVGAAEFVGRRGHESITVAADGLVVDKGARRDHELRSRAQGTAAENGAADADAGPERAGTVIAADGLVMAERAAGDGEAAGVLDGAAGACRAAVAAAVATGLRHVEGEPTVGDASNA